MPITLAAFKQQHPREFFHYKDLQHENLFGPTMAFRVTRTMGWLKPALCNGQPKYLPEQVLEALNRLRAGEVPEEYDDCLGRGKSGKGRPIGSRKSSPTVPPPIPISVSSPLMPFRPLIARKISHRGLRRWRIIVGKEWARVLKCEPGSRRVFQSKTAAADYVEEAKLRLAESSKSHGEFTDEQFLTFRLVLSMVDNNHEKLLEAVRIFKEQAAAKPSARSRKAKVVARHYLMTRLLNGKLRKKSISTARYEARLFAKAFGNDLINEITHGEIQVWVRKLKLKAKGKKNVMGTVKLIFDHAIKLELRKDNPTAGIELPRVNGSEPERYSAAQCEQLLKTGVKNKHPILLALVVGLFTGARPAEVTRTGWEKISLSEERINIPGEAGKTHLFRWVKIYPILREWLEFIGIKKHGPLIPRHDIETYERWRQQLAAAAGLDGDWPHDVLRHTHASFDYALKGDFDAVSENLGNTKTVARRNYIAPATLTEAKQFLALTPKYIQGVIAKNGAAPKNGKTPEK